MRFPLLASVALASLAFAAEPKEVRPSVDIVKQLNGTYADGDFCAFYQLVETAPLPVEDPELKQLLMDFKTYEGPEMVHHFLQNHTPGIYKLVYSVLYDKEPENSELELSEITFDMAKVLEFFYSTGNLDGVLLAVKDTELDMTDPEVCAIIQKMADGGAAEFLEAALSTLASLPFAAEPTQAGQPANIVKQLNDAYASGDFCTFYSLVENAVLPIEDPELKQLLVDLKTYEGPEIIRHFLQNPTSGIYGMVQEVLLA